MKRKTVKDWDKTMPSFPVGLYMQPVGANRAQRRKMREHKNDPMPPGSMRPAVKRFVKTLQTVPDPMDPKNKTIQIMAQTGRVEYVAA